MLWFAAVTGRQKDILRRDFEAGRAESRFFLRVPAAPQESQWPLPDPKPGFPRARKLERPQGVPFIALFPLCAVPAGPGLSKFLPLPPLSPPHPVAPAQLWQGAGVQPRQDPLIRSRCSGSHIPIGLGRRPPAVPSFLGVSATGVSQWEEGGSPRGWGALGLGEWDQTGVSQRRGAGNWPAFPNVGSSAEQT